MVSASEGDTVVSDVIERREDSWYGVEEESR